MVVTMTSFPRVVGALALVAATLPGQFVVRLTVSSGGSSAGGPCGFTSCTPDPLAVVPGGSLHISTNAVYGGTIFVLIGMPGGPCTPVPGIDGMLIAQPPGLVYVMVPTGLTHLYISWGPSGPQVPCSLRLASSSLAVPNNIPVGLQFVMQTLVQTGLGWGFSNGVLLTIQ